MISNASKYSPDNSHIRLAVELRDDSLTVAVQDWGFGIPESDLQHVGTPFFRSDTEKTRQIAGTGLGVYVTRSIVELHSGEFGIESREGEGTTVTIKLPGISDRPADLQETASAAPKYHSAFEDLADSTL